MVPPRRRAAALGRLMMMYTIGATVGPALGGAVQVDPIQPTFTASGTKRSKPQCDEPLSNFAQSRLAPLQLGGHLGAAGNFRLGARLAAAGSVLSAALACFLPGGPRASEDGDGGGGSAGGGSGGVGVVGGSGGGVVDDKAKKPSGGTGLHSSTFQLNLHC